MKNEIRLLALLILLCTLPAFAQTEKGAREKSKDSSVTVAQPSRVKLGGFSVGAGYSFMSGRFPYYAPWYWDPFHFHALYGISPDFYYPHAYPLWYSSFERGPNMGEIRIKTSVENARVYLDDGLAGEAKDLKEIWLDPGVYNLRVEADRHDPYAVRVYVLTGKTLKIDAKLVPRREVATP